MSTSRYDRLCAIVDKAKTEGDQDTDAYATAIEELFVGEPPEWHFWLPDDDRSAGWTNHCYVLQFVCTGRGHTPEQAWADAKSTGQIPDDFQLPETVKAIRGDSEHDVTVS